MEVPFFKPSIGPKEQGNVLEVLRSGWLTTGRYVQEFEQKFSEYIGVKYCVALNSATAALHLSVAISGIKPGEYVLVPTMTFASTAEVLYYCGIKPILVDCDLKDLSISATDAKKKLLLAQKEGKSVRGIIPVHYAGKIVNMDSIEVLAEEFDLKIIEDAAHCCGSQYFSQKYNQWLSKSPKSLTQCYSFYCNKCITTCGEGGMLATDSKEIADRARSLSLHGLSTNAWDRFGKQGNIFYDITESGYKYNLTDVAAAMGCAQLENAENLKLKRTAFVKLYKNLLKSNPHFSFLEDKEECFVHSYHLLVVKYNQPNKDFLSRDELLQALKERNIVPSVHWKPLHMHTFYKNQGFTNEAFPNATKVFDQIISLPLFADMTEAQVYYVVDALNALTNDKTFF